jgi:hypothetical protein
VNGNGTRSAPTAAAACFAVLLPFANGAASDLRSFAWRASQSLRVSKPGDRKRSPGVEKCEASGGRLREHDHHPRPMSFVTTLATATASAGRGDVSC